MTTSLRIIDAVLAGLDLAVAIMLWRALRHRFRSHWWLMLLLAYFVIRGVERAVEATGTGDAARLGFASLIVPVLVGLALGLRQVSDLLGRKETEAERARSDAARASAEYRRALQDFTTLARHRMANPLTALSGGIATLRDLYDELDPATRRQVLDAMADTARRLEHVSLHPELQGDEERGHDPVPHLDTDAFAQSGEIDAVRNEQHFREVNETLVEQLAHVAPFAEMIDMTCECWSLECTDTVPVTLATYLRIAARHERYIVVPGHVLPTVEDVVERSEAFWVVHKHERAVQRAQRRDNP